MTTYVPWVVCESLARVENGWIVVLRNNVQKPETYVYRLLDDALDAIRRAAEAVNEWAP